MNRVTGLICALVIVGISWLGWAVNHYRANAAEYKHQRDNLQATNTQLIGQINWQNNTQRAVAAIDEHRTKELNDAKNQIDDLRSLIASGARKLQLAATCPTASASGVVDATSPRLTDAAERDYFRLRERIETARSQIAGLQDYIREVCLR